MSSNNNNTDRQHGTPIGHRYDLYLVGGIDSPDKYIDWFQTIRNAQPSDIIRIFINSEGGHGFTAVQMVKAIRDSAAHIICCVEGLCCSAATMIFLQADGYEISDHSSFLFHNYRGGAIGKGHEIEAHVAHSTKWADHLARDVYQDFLTDDEIEKILSGVDLWMSPQDVHERLLKRMKIWEERMNTDKKKKTATKKTPRKRAKNAN